MEPPLGGGGASSARSKRRRSIESPVGTPSTTNPPNVVDKPVGGEKTIRKDTQTIAQRTMAMLLAGQRLQSNSTPGHQSCVHTAQSTTTTTTCLKCTSCKKIICDSCRQSCIACRGEFCGTCIVTNYSERFERLFCIDCNIRLKNAA